MVAETLSPIHLDDPDTIYGVPPGIMHDTIDPVFVAQNLANMIWSTEFEPITDTNEALEDLSALLHEKKLAKSKARWRIFPGLTNASEAEVKAIVNRIVREVKTLSAAKITLYQAQSSYPLPSIAATSTLSEEHTDIANITLASNFTVAERVSGDEEETTHFDWRAYYQAYGQSIDKQGKPQNEKTTQYTVCAIKTALDEYNTRIKVKVPLESTSIEDWVASICGDNDRKKADLLKMIEDIRTNPQSDGVEELRKNRVKLDGKSYIVHSYKPNRRRALSVTDPSSKNARITFIHLGNTNEIGLLQLFTDHDKYKKYYGFRR